MVAVLTLALGIFAQTLVLAVVDALVFRPAREAHVDGVYAVRRFDARTQKPLPALSLTDFRLLESRPPEGVAALAAVGLEYVTLQAPQGAERVWAGLVTGGWAQVFQLKAQAGRLIDPDDDHPGAPSVAIISDRIWRAYYGGNPDIIGRVSIDVDGRSFVIVGVTRRGFRDALTPCDLWIARARWGAILPSASNAYDRFSRGFAGWTYARFRAGASPAAIGPALRATLASVERVEPTVRLTVTPATTGTLQAQHYGALAIAMAMLVLLAACANVTSLFHVRTVVGGRELAVKRALGARSSALFIPLFAEATMIAAIAGAFGAALAFAGSSLLRTAFPTVLVNRYARLSLDGTLDGHALLWAFVGSAVSALIVGSAAAWRANRLTPLEFLSRSGASIGSTAHGQRFRLSLVSLQVTGAVVTVIAAGLLYIRAGENVPYDRAAFDTSRLASARIDLSLHGFEESRGRAFQARLLDAAAAVPGVERAALADAVPGDTTSTSVMVTARRQPGAVLGRPKRSGAHHESVSPGFLATLGLPLIHGRTFTQVDTAGAPLVAIVSRSLAGVLWPTHDALGQQVMVGFDGRWRTVVGVSEDAIQTIADSPLDSRANLVLIPSAQHYEPAMTLIVRTETPAAIVQPLRLAIRSLGNVAVFDAAPLAGSILAWNAAFGAAATLLGLLAAVALMIAVLGVYGLVSHVTSARMREFGIRLALGATPADVQKIVFDSTLHVVLVGLLVGVLIASLSERVLENHIAQLMPNDVSTWIAVPLAILAAGMFAGFIPARRASRVDPNVVLREL